MLSILMISALASGCLRSQYKIAFERIGQSEYEKALLGIDVPEEEVFQFTLEEAIAMALCMNLELSVKAREIQYQEEALTRARFSIVPKLLLEGVSSYRNKNTGSASESLVAGVPPAPPSISSQQKVRTYDITFTWNLLDFGISYYRARQEADRMLIKEYEYEREKQRIILEVVRLFWALAAEAKSSIQAQILWDMSNSVLARIQENVDKGNLGAEQGARFSSQLLSIQLKIKDHLKEYEKTNAEFKALLGLPPQAQIELVNADEIPVDPCFPPMTEMENLALINRPELFQKDLEAHALADETRIALIQLFPALSPFTSQNYDGNRFLIFHHWWVAGVNASWNLLTIPGNIGFMQAAQAQKEVVRSQSLVQAMGIVTQLHLAYNLYQEDLDRYQAGNALRKQTAILRYGALKRQEMAAIGDIQVFLASAEAYEADLEAGRSYAFLMGTLELVNSSMGLPFYISPYGSCNLCSDPQDE